ncbi:U32 family peptidase C-terminal domain-containing protein [Candidatus Microgenomates bacterium]|nr:U32 family peptidase C-terminal domain-containing protein [Candidatus Microgenomates bacterium]
MVTRKNKIELLSPAGDLPRLKTAVAFGADAVYCGLPQWSLRNIREIQFNEETIREGVTFAHERGVKVYVTCNIFPHESHIKLLKKDLAKLNKIGFDGIILSDIGMLSLAKEFAPDIPIHLSTQANTTNSEAIKMWQVLGVKRVILARELSLLEIKKIHEAVPDIELEIFVHGAMCMAYSGRCLLSKHYTGRDANLGDCANSCRWKYQVKNKAPEKVFVQEESRPDDALEISEDEHGTYFMNAKDLSALDILDQVLDSGVVSVKIEGRAKSIYYVGMITRLYRQALDSLYAGKKVDEKLFAELDMVANRGYNHGFLLGRDGYEQEYDVAAIKPNLDFLGQVSEVQDSKFKNYDIKNSLKITKLKIKNYVLVEVKNKFAVGDEVEIVTPDQIVKTKITEIFDNGSLVSEIKKPGEMVEVSFAIGEGVPPYSLIRRKKN